MSSFVHAIDRGGNFHTHVLLPYRLIPLSAYLQNEDTLPDPDRGVRSTNSFCVPRARQKIPVRHQNDRLRHGFLRSRFVDLERAALDLQPVKFCDGLCGVISRPEFDESKTA